MSFRPTMIFLKFQWLKISLKLNKLTFQIFGNSRFGGLSRSQAPPKLNRAPNLPKKGAKLTGMDIGEFTYTLWPNS